MTTSSQIGKPRHTYCDPTYQATIDGGYSGGLTVTAARGRKPNGTLVFVESELLGSLVLTREQAASLAYELREASQMSSAPQDAEFLAESVSDALARAGVTRAQVAAAVQIPRRRLARLLAGKAAMRKEELIALAKLAPRA